MLINTLTCHVSQLNNNINDYLKYQVINPSLVDGSSMSGKSSVSATSHDVLVVWSSASRHWWNNMAWRTTICSHHNSSTLSSKCFCWKQIYLRNQVSIYSITCICDDLVYLCVFTAAVTLNVLQDGMKIGQSHLPQAYYFSQGAKILVDKHVWLICVYPVICNK